MVPQNVVPEALHVPGLQFGPPTHKPDSHVQSLEQLPHWILPLQPSPTSPQYCPPVGEHVAGTHAGGPLLAPPPGGVMLMLPPVPFPGAAPVARLLPPVPDGPAATPLLFELVLQPAATRSPSPKQRARLTSGVMRGDAASITLPRRIERAKCLIESELRGIVATALDAMS
jgi:hypothetical protein